jgi:hypothetical protein
MSLRFAVMIVALAALCHAAAATAQQKAAAKRDEQAKVLADEVVKTLVEEDVDSLMKKVAVPYLVRIKNKFQTVSKIKELKKQLTAIVEKMKKDESLGQLKAFKVSFEVETYERFLRRVTATPKVKAIGKVLKKTDRVLKLYQEGDEKKRFLGIVFLMSWRDGKPKVVGIMIPETGE